MALPHLLIKKKQSLENIVKKSTVKLSSAEHDCFIIIFVVFPTQDVLMYRQNPRDIFFSYLHLNSTVNSVKRDTIDNWLISIT